MYTIIYQKQKEKINRRYEPEKFFIEGYGYSVWSKNQEVSTDKEEPTDKKE